MRRLTFAAWVCVVGMAATVILFLWVTVIAVRAVAEPLPLAPLEAPTVEPLPLAPKTIEGAVRLSAPTVRAAVTLAALREAGA